MALNVRIRVSLELIYLIKTEYYSQFLTKDHVLQQFSSRSALQGPYRKKLFFCFLSGFFSIPFVHTIFSLPPAGMKPVSWDVPMDLEQFLSGLKVVKN